MNPSKSQAIFSVANFLPGLLAKLSADMKEGMFSKFTK